jgi:hypothetical protein
MTYKTEGGAMRALIAALVFLLAGSLLAQKVHVRMTVRGTGFIAHEKCVKNKADPAQCSPQCPKAGDKLVFVSEKGKPIKVDNPDEARAYLGKKVTVNGTIEGDSTDRIHLDSIAPAD